MAWHILPLGVEIKHGDELCDPAEKSVFHIIVQYKNIDENSVVHLQILVFYLGKSSIILPDFRKLHRIALIGFHVLKKIPFYGIL